MAKDHSDSERLLPHGLLFPISSKGSFIYASSQGLCYTNHGALAVTIYLRTHSTLFVYCYIILDIWLRTTQMWSTG